MKPPPSALDGVAADLGVASPAARIIGDVSPKDFAALAAGADADAVCFADRAHEARWLARALD